MDWLGFDWTLLGAYLAKIGVALLLTLPVAWERERSTRIMGLRTFPLVAVASCGYVLIAVAVVGSSADGQARIIQGLMSGIGFIGGGAILKEGAKGCRTYLNRNAVVLLVIFGAVVAWYLIPALLLFFTGILLAVVLNMPSARLAQVSPLRIHWALVLVS